MTTKSQFIQWFMPLLIADYMSRDVQGAQNAGMRAALLKRDDSEPLRPGAKEYDGRGGKIHVIASLGETITMLKT